MRTPADAPLALGGTIVSHHPREALVSEHSEVVAGFGAGLECPASCAACCQACQEAAGTLAQAGPSSRGRWLLEHAVLAAQAQLAHHALEELCHIVLQSG